MPNLRRLVTLILLFFIYQTAYSQFGFSHEIGVIAGPVQFRSDFGSRNETITNFGNSGYGVGFVHYINFAYRSDCNCFTGDKYFNNHFKLRNEISYNKTKLEHLGFWVAADKTSVEAEQLRTHKGVAENYDFGMQLEFFLKSIQSFMGYTYKFAPFVSLGAHYTSFNPKASTSFGNGDVFDRSNIYSLWFENFPLESNDYPINVNRGNTWSIVSSAGFRYKLTKLSDLMLDFRAQYYFNDFVDGLDHNWNDYDKNNDWLIWLNLGYIIYLY